MATYKEAEATFNFRLGEFTGDITVGSKSAPPKTRDDWIISLALDAGQQVSNSHNTKLQAISFKLDSITLK